MRHCCEQILLPGGQSDHGDDLVIEELYQRLLGVVPIEIVGCSEARRNSECQDRRPVA